MLKEKQQVNDVKGLNVGRIGFISTSGFEEEPAEFDCIDAEQMYAL